MGTAVDRRVQCSTRVGRPDGDNRVLGARGPRARGPRALASRLRPRAGRRWRSFGLALLLTSVSSWAARGQDDGPVSVPVVPTGTGQEVRALLLARTVRLAEPYRYRWHAEQVSVSEVTVLVMEIDREFLRPRQVDVPVLYVGTLPAEVASSGYGSGRRIVVVPGVPDLATTAIYFGSTELPERVTHARGQAELAAAHAAGVRPQGAEAVARARAAGGEPLAVATRELLYLYLAELLDRFAPDEAELAELYRINARGE